MKKIILNKIIIENFKGIKSLEMAINGVSIDIRGKNASGKTTVKDAYLWCLFGKDSSGRSDFKIRPITDDLNAEKEKDGSETKVELVFLVDGREVNFKRSYKEKWTKKRGSETYSFDGYSTSYFVDDIPHKEKEWGPKIESILAPEQTLRLVMDDMYFNSLDMRKKRDILMDGQAINDLDLAKSEKKYDFLVEQFESGKTTDDLKKMYAYQVKELKSKFENIDPRIDELTKQMTATDGNDEELAEKLNLEIKKLEEQIADKKAALTSNDVIVQKQSIQLEIANLRSKINEIKMEGFQKYQDEQEKIRVQQNDIQEKYDEVLLEERKLKQNVDELMISRNRLEEQNVLLKSEVDRLANEYSQVSSEEPNVMTSCPTCGQALPEEKIGEAIVKFRQQQNSKLDAITATGQAKSTEIRENKQKISKLDSDIANSTPKIADLAAKKATLEQALENCKQQLGQVRIEKNPEIDKLSERIRELSDNYYQIDSAIVNPANDAELVNLENAIKEHRQTYWQLQLNINNQARIIQLQADAKSLATKIEQIITKQSLLEQFIKDKINQVVVKINSMFNLVKFQLFETQINGGLNEVCYATVDNVPFSDLNTAMKINAGLDIINTLSEKYQLSAPIFIDNAESVTNILPTGGQQIRLYVDDNYDKLHF